MNLLYCLVLIELVHVTSIYQLIYLETYIAKKKRYYHFSSTKMGVWQTSAMYELWPYSITIEIFVTTAHRFHPFKHYRLIAPEVSPSIKLCTFSKDTIFTSPGTVCFKAQAAEAKSIA